MLKATEKFDEALGNIVNIIVSYDMGWSKRGNGRSYDSLNGYGAIIGFFSGKVLDFATRNRKCKFCDAGRSKEDHDCRLNFQGSAKAMEPDVGVESVNRSTVVKDAGLNVRVLIGDEDSSTIAAVRRGNSQQIFKLADTNHLRKHFVSELYELQKTYKEMKKKEAIPHLKKCFGYAVAQNKGKSVELANCLRSIPDHFFNRHDNCGHWCLRRCDSSGVQKVVFQDPGLYEKLNGIFTKYANNAAKFSVAASSQANESLNNIMSHKAPKNRCYSLSEWADFRFSSAVCNKNEGDSYLLAVSEKVRVSPGKNTATFVEKNQVKRSERASKAKLPSAKSRRNVLADQRQALRKKAEQVEGIQYQSNCGFDMETDDLGNNIAEDMDNNNMENALPVDSNFIFFDLETSGLHKSADILQIAAKCSESTFSEYANPSQPITPSATAITGLRNVAGELFLYDKRLPSIPIPEVLRKFQEWLVFFQPCILVAHNAKFDTPRLLQAFKKNSMIVDLKKVIVAFADTLVILKKLHPERKGPGMFKLSRLAKDLLHVEPNEKFHEASYDVDILEKIASTIPKEKLIANSKSFTQCFFHEARLKKAAVLERSLNVFKGVISPGMIKKIASAGIDNSEIQKVYAESGRDGIVRLLSTNHTDKKPRVTKDKKILEKILVFLETNQSSV
ncbi:uncharacterized protein LOC124292972 [Neodiprion lecontei]|uniref:Uncharacterized protein LOC124292972 n=1 Tax=Neodiprion lecontei TaxID=441921 RepID=A0ABM3FIH2_NEOLC|nr:uncharacterized protein LOC124292972 [Neodiprion lecontei]